MRTQRQIVQTNFKVRIPWSEFELLCQQVAEHIANVPGLTWKIWLRNDTRKEAGGIYLFETEEAAAIFLAGPIVAQLKQNTAFTNLEIKIFGILEAPSAITGFALSSSLPVPTA